TAIPEDIPLSRPRPALPQRSGEAPSNTGQQGVFTRLGNFLSNFNPITSSQAQPAVSQIKLNADASQAQIDEFVSTNRKSVDWQKMWPTDTQVLLLGD